MSSRLSRLQTPRRSVLSVTSRVTSASVGAGVEVEDAAAVGVGEHAGARGGAERGEPAGDVPAAPHDDERDEVGQPDQRLGAGVAGGAGRAGPPRRARRCSQRGGDHLLDQRARCPRPLPRCAERPATRALSTCDATSTVTLGRASKTAPITPTGTRRSNTRSPSAARGRNAERRLGGVGEHVELDGHVGEALGGEAQAVEQARGHAVLLRGLDVGGVGGQQLGARSRSSPAAVRRAASMAGPPAARTPGAAAAARCAESRTAASASVVGEVVLTATDSHERAGVGGTPLDIYRRSEAARSDRHVTEPTIIADDGTKRA